MKSAIKSVENNVGATTTTTFIMAKRHRAHRHAQIEDIYFANNSMDIHQMERMERENKPGYRTLTY